MIQFEEGPRMFGNVAGAPNDSVKVGDAVAFDPVAPEVSLPRFRPSYGPHRTLESVFRCSSRRRGTMYA